MTIVLDSTSKSLEIALAAAVATNELTFVTGYADYTDTPAFVPGSADGTTNGTSDVTIVSAPAADTQRMVSSISVWNKDTASATVTIQLDNTGVDRELVCVALTAGDSLHYTGEQWFVLSNTGGRRVVQAIHDHSSAAEGGASLGAHTVTGNVTLDDGVGDSPKILLVGGTNDDQVEAYLDDDAAAGASDLIVKLADNAGASKLIVQDSDGVTVAVIDSEGRIGAGTAPGILLHSYRNDAVTGTKTQLRIEQDGVGDATMDFYLTSIVQWLVGIDHSDANKFKIVNATGGSVFTAKGIIIDTAGKIGLGTASPAYPFHLVTSFGSYIALLYNDGGTSAQHGIALQIGEDANPTAIFLRMNDGNGTYTGHIIGDGAGGVNYLTASDERRKDVIGNVSQAKAIQALDQVSPIRYKGIKGKHESVGFVAQDINAVFPEIAPYNEDDDVYSIDYGRLTTVLWAQNQALLARIEALEANRAHQPRAPEAAAAGERRG